MMRIESDQDALGALGTLPTRQRDTGSAVASATAHDFASALLAAENSGARPPAERWGQYGKGGQPGGFGPPPDAATFADVPVGPTAAASPLNPGGITTDAAFEIPGYTGRGTPIPPGFYNLAYYHQYLAEGGAPLEGFPAWEPGTTIAETYGSFGDGRTRATSFAPESSDGGMKGCDGSSVAELAASVSVPKTALAPAPARESGNAKADALASAPAADTSAPETAVGTPVGGDEVMRAALRAGLTALLTDLLRRG